MWASWRRSSATLPAGLRAAFEFRHESWLADDVYAVLRRHDAALCIADSEEFATPFVATAGWGYLRLRRQDYDKAALRRWAKRLRRTELRRRVRVLQARGGGRRAGACRFLPKHDDLTTMQIFGMYPTRDYTGTHHG
jgi:hypothetical protein